MSTLYRLLTAALALIGCASLAITGEIRPVMSISGLALIPGYYRFLRGESHAPVIVIGLLSIVELVIFLFDAVAISGDAFLAVAHLTIAFQALKSFDLKEPWDNLQVYFVSLLQLVIASELTNSLAFGVVFVVFLVVLVAAMVLSHFMKEGRAETASVKGPVYAVTVFTLLLTTFLFVVIPRTTHRFIGKSYSRGMHTTGFSERMDFVSFGNVKLDPAVVMRVEMSGDLSGPFYWRGYTLDRFDGLTWQNDLPRQRIRLRKNGDQFISEPYDTNRSVAQQIYLEPLDSEVIFGLSQIKGIRTDLYSVMQDSAGNFFIPGKSSRRIRYAAYSVLSDDLPGISDPRYLQLPAENRKIAELAREITRNERDSIRKARAVEAYLMKNYAYSLSVSSPPAGVSPIEDFLFRSKKGFCEHYATAMVLMLRSIGIPARVVTGFIGGDRNAYGGYLIVRRSDAHSWVEALIGGRWKRFDPTPSVSARRPQSVMLMLDSVEMYWARYIVGYSSMDQQALVEMLGRLFGSGHTAGRAKEAPGTFALRHILYSALGVTLILAVLIFVLRKKYRRRHGPATASYLRIRRALFRKGFPITSSTTSDDIVSLTAGAPYSSSLRQYLDRYRRRRFGLQKDDSDIRSLAEQVIGEIRSSARSRKK